MLFWRIALQQTTTKAGAPVKPLTWNTFDVVVKEAACHINARKPRKHRLRKSYMKHNAYNGDQWLWAAPDIQTGRP